MTSLQSRKPLDVLHFLYNVNRAVLNIARAEKPTGAWPEWAIEADMQLTTLQHEFRLAMKAAL